MAADRSFYFPSSTGGYDLPNGSLVRIKIWYNDTGLGSPSNTDMTGVSLLQLGQIKIPLQITPSGTPGSAEYRHAAMDLTLENPAYDTTNNYFEQYSILNDSYNLDTFIAIYVDGSEYWRGVIDFPQVRRFDYYQDGSSFKYRQIKIKALDALYYFWSHDVTLADVSWDIDEPLEYNLDLIGTEAGFGGDPVLIDANLKISEHAGAVEILVEDMYLSGVTTSDQISVWLKSFAHSLGLVFYNHKGKIYFTFIGNVGAAVAITKDYLKKAERKENANPIERVDFSSDMAYSSSKFPASYSGQTFYSDVIGGTLSEDTVRNFIIDAKAIISEFYTRGTESDHGTPPTTFDNVTDTEIQEANGIGNFITGLVESGDLVGAQYSSGAYTALASYIYQTIVTDVPDEESVFFHDVGPSPLNNIALIILFYGGTNDARYKFYKIGQLVGAAFVAYFLTSPDILRVQVADVSTFDDFQKKYTFAGNSYKIKSAIINLEKDDLTMELMRVA